MTTLTSGPAKFFCGSFMLVSALSQVPQSWPRWCSRSRFSIQQLPIRRRPFILLGNFLGRSACFLLPGLPVKFLGFFDLPLYSELVRDQSAASFSESAP